MKRAARHAGAPCVALVLGLALLGAPRDAGAGPLDPQPEQYGAIEFPRDEHVHPDGWDWWWGAADILTESGNRYTAELDPMTSLNGIASSVHLLWAWQGPYRGLTVVTDYGSPAETTGRYLRRFSAYVPGVMELLDLETLDLIDGTTSGGRLASLWRRTTLADHQYGLHLDDPNAIVSPEPTPTRVTWHMDLQTTMRRPPLLVGGDGRFFYGVPEGFGYPSRSFQYMQAAEAISGTLDLQQPDGSVLHETVDPSGSSVIMVHEYDATPEDVPGGVALALANELHPRYAQYYQGGLGYELLFADLGNGAQLFVAVLVFQDFEPGTLSPLLGTHMPAFQAQATLRLPTGESIPLDETSGLNVEHLSYRTAVGQVPGFLLYFSGIWKEAWTYRVHYAGGTIGGVPLPAFDLGFVPRFAPDEPVLDAQGNGERQRVPFVVSGTYAGCPVHGFAWSELTVNWYNYDRDPWFTGGALPEVPSQCQ